MAGPGALVITATGSITAPSQLSISTPSALSAVFGRSGQFDLASFPNLRAIGVANGIDFQYHLLDAAQYLTGPRAPYTAPTMSNTAAKAATVQNFTGNPATDSLVILVGKPGVSVTQGGVTYFVSGSIRFSTSLTPTGLPVNLVKIEATLAGTITNLVALVNGTAGHGTKYFSDAIRNFGGTNTMFGAGFLDISITASTGTSATYTASTAGVAGNTYYASEGLDSGGVSSFTNTPTFAGGADGSGTAPPAGTYLYAYRYNRLADGALTAISLQATLSQSSLGNNTAATLDAPATRDGINLYNLMRSPTDASLLYQTVESSGTPITDTQTDAQITRDGNLPYDPNIVRPYLGGYPVHYKCHTEHLGSMFGTGAYLAAKQSAGTASVTITSRSVTLSSGPKVKTDYIGRTFRVTSESQTYVIVDVTATTLTLNQPYLGATNGTAAYEILDERDPFFLYYTPPLLLNNWPVENSLEGEIHSDDPRGGTAIRSMWGNLAVWTRTGTWRVLGSPDTGFRVVPQTEGSGCFNNRCVVDVNGSLFWIGADGVQAWDGSGDPQPLSSPRIGSGGVVTGIDATIQRINTLAVEGAVGNYNPSINVIRWAVPVDGSLWNNLIIQLNLQTGTFTFVNCDAITAMDSVVGPSGTYVTIAGDMYGGLWQMDNGTSDGAYGFECVQTITAYDTVTNKISVAATPFPTATNADLRGVPVLMISADGTRQRGTIGANTSSVLTLTQPPDTAPAVGTQIVVGGIFWRMMTSKFSGGDPAERKTVSSITMHFITATAGQVWCAVSVESGDPTCKVLLDGTTDYASLTATKGTKYFDFPRGPGRTTQIELFALAPGFDLACVGLEATYRVREQVPR